MALNVGIYHLTTDASYLEAKKQFTHAYNLIADFLIKDAKRFVDNMDPVTYEYALRLADSHQEDDLKTVIDYVFLSIEIRRSKLWPHHMKECKEKMAKINWEAFKTPIVYPSFNWVLLTGDLYEVVKHNSKSAFFKASGLRFSCGENNDFYLFLSDCGGYTFSVPKKTAVDNRHFKILNEDK